MGRRFDWVGPWVIAAATVGLGLGERGCAAKEGCLGGDDGVCVPAEPCAALRFACDDPSLEIGRVADPASLRRGLDALSARGDIVLGNARLAATIDALDAPHHLAPTGGNLVDLTPRPAGAGTDDGLNQMLQAVGILPDDVVRYEHLELVDRRPELVAVIARGRLDGRPRATVVTRYEVRPCEPGVRIRTEVHQGERDPQTFFPADAFYWGGRSQAPFAPAPGRGFVHPELQLAEIGDAFVTQPFLASRSQDGSAASYALVACDRPSVEGFHSEVISAVGHPRTILLTGDAIAFERFVAVAPGPGASRAADVALDVRSRLFGEPSVVLRGRVVVAAATDAPTLASVSFLVVEGATPWTEVVPAADGSFSARVPANRRLEIRPAVLGRPLPQRVVVDVAGTDVDMPDVTVPPAGVLDVRLLDGSGRPFLGEVVLTPFDPVVFEALRGSLQGVFNAPQCSPYLGAPHGGSPACNRVLVEPDGAASFAVPPGDFWVYATGGPARTIARERVTIRAGERAEARLVVHDLPGLVPDGVLAADFHVHGGASFDSSLPDRDRVKSFVATGIDVLAATDHDVVTTYEAAIGALGIGDRVRVLPGVETTGQILFYKPPGADIPKVPGHFNFWPLRSDPTTFRNGAPADERLLPAELYERMAASFDGRGVIQMNHPYSPSEFGRDQGFFSVVSYDPRRPVASVPELLRRAPGGKTDMDYDAQEVMCGASMRGFLQYRAVWHSLLSQGILRAGTANSDSHTLGVELLGYPRNLVFGGHHLATFDREAFDADVRAGKMTGTNGPVLLASIDGAGPSLTALRPSAGASLAIELRAAPWIPVEEIRVVVGGRVARTIRDVARPADPFGTEGLVRWRGTVPLAELLGAGDGDTWIVVEAGYPLVAAADLDGDGIVDTTDNDGDGAIDARDQVGDEENWFTEPPRPREGDPRFHAHVVAPGLWPTAFTNPFLIDRGESGWRAPGLSR